MKSTAERPVHTGGIRKASPYLAVAITPALLAGAVVPDAILRAIDDGAKRAHELRLPADEMDQRMLEYSRDLPALHVVTSEEVDPVFEARANRTQVRRAKLRRAKGARQLVESQADIAHLA